jgi:hypothetical protein
MIRRVSKNESYSESYINQIGIVNPNLERSNLKFFCVDWVSESS